jgi:hypothetical protein
MSINGKIRPVGGPASDIGRLIGSLYTDKMKIFKKQNPAVPIDKEMIDKLRKIEDFSIEEYFSARGISSVQEQNDFKARVNFYKARYLQVQVKNLNKSDDIAVDTITSFIKNRDIIFR